MAEAALLSIFTKALGVGLLPLGVSPVSFRFRVGLDGCQWAWLVLPIQVAGSDSVLTLGSGGRGGEAGLGGLPRRKRHRLNPPGY